MDDAIFDRYKSNDIIYLMKAITLIEDEDKLNKTYEYILKQQNIKKKRSDDYSAKYDIYGWKIIKGMIDDGIVYWDKDRLVINQVMKDSLSKFVEFLKENDKKIRDNHYYYFENERIFFNEESEEVDNESIQNKI